MAYDSHSISMDGSVLSWSDADKRAKSIGFQDRSKYIQFLIEKDIFRGKLWNKERLTFVLLIEMTVILLLLVLR